MEQLALRKPEWLTITPPKNNYKVNSIKENLNKFNLHTVCEESHCPNISECWSSGTATFMIMGDTCTRGCKFCNVKTYYKGIELDKDEPIKLAEAVKNLDLDYIVVTSVDRDDLNDQGSSHFAECIRELKKNNILVEVLIPDFKADYYCIKRIVESKPDVIAHNIETIRRLQKKVRDPRANYEQSLKVLRTIKELNKNIFTKSSIMLGFGETDEEVIKTMKDLREIDVDLFTLGQYLRPSQRHLNVEEFIHPDKFKFFEIKGKELGFRYVASGPFVRSSYKAGELFVKNLLKNNP
ncbi:lipoyl synthase [Candidatus Woesearchaeota archaeon]|nr:lipoyl synthase [Candidatus Woesearchaeota archaeon]